MKTFLNIIILLTFLCLTLSSCKKTSPGPEPIVQTNNSTTSTLSAEELSLVGNWGFDSTKSFNAGVECVPCKIVYNDPSVYHIQFNSTNGPLTPYKECINGTSGSDIITNWEITTLDKLYIQSTTYTIESSTTTNLCYYYGSLTGTCVKYYFHRL